MIRRCQTQNKTEERQTKVCCFKAMASVLELLLIANLMLLGSVYGFPLQKDAEQTCGYEVGFMFCFIFDDRVSNWRIYMEMFTGTRFLSGFVVIRLTF